MNRFLLILVINCLTYTSVFAQQADGLKKESDYLPILTKEKEILINSFNKTLKSKSFSKSAKSNTSAKSSLLSPVGTCNLITCGSFNQEDTSNSIGFRNAIDGSKYAADVTYNCWNDVGTVDYSEGQYISYSDVNANINTPAIISPSFDGGGFSIFSFQNEGISQNLTVLPNTNYTVCFEIAVIPRYSNINGSFVEFVPDLEFGIGSGGIAITDPLTYTHNDLNIQPLSNFPTRLSTSTIGAFQNPRGWTDINPYWETKCITFKTDASGSVNIFYNTGTPGRSVILVDGLRLSLEGYAVPPTLTNTASSAQGSGTVVYCDPAPLTINLNDYIASTGPAKSTLTWSTNVDPLITTDHLPSSIIPPTTATYYAFYYNSTDFCSSPAVQLDIILNDLQVVLESTPSNVSCNAASDASISIAVTGGTTNYSFAWTKDGSPFSSDEDLTGLAPGTYQVTVTDANNCSVSLNAPVTITEPEVLAVSLESTPSNVSCNAASDASISIAVTGGTTNYSFAWTKDGNAFSSDEDLTGLAPGTYQVTVTDANNCSVSLNAPVTITEPEVLAVSLESTPNNVSCNAASDASISIAVTGGTTNYSFAWTKDGNAFSSDEDLTGLAPGTYQVTVTDANNCSVSLNAPVTIIQPEVLAVSLESTPNNVSCNAASNASISIAVTGGTTNYSFAWTKDGNAFSSDEDLTGLAPGTYQVTVTDANNCSVSLNAPVTITQPEVLAVSLESTPSNVSCNTASDASISIAVTGGTTNYSFTWTKDGNAFSSDEDLTGLAPGTYQVTITDANNCSVSLNAPVTITQPEVLAVSLESTPNNVSCNAASDASISIAVTGGTTNYSFAWTKDGNAFSSDEDLTGLAPGTYQVTVTDANNCSVSLNAPVTITEPEVLAVSLESTPSNVSCNAASDASISIAVTGGTTNYSFAWTKDGNAFSSDEDLTGLAPGTYQVTVTDANNCSVSLNAPVTITEPEVLAVSLESTPNNVSCNAASDASISIAVTGGTTNYSFAWTKDGNAFSSDEDLTGLAPGTYQVTVTDANNCSVSLNAPVTIIQPEVLAVSLESTPNNVSCNAASNASISIAVTGGTTNYSFAWTKDGNAFSSDEDLTGLAPGTYQVTVTDANNCSVSLNAPVTITQPEVLAVSLESTPSNVSCNTASDASISIAVTGGTTNYSFTWTKDGNAFSSDEDLTGLAPGTYQVTITDANNCSVSLNAPVTITQPEVLAVSLESTPSNVSCNTASDASISIAVTGGTTNYSFAWTKDGNAFSSDEDLTGLAPGTYQVTVTDANNCSVSLNAPVTIIQPEVLAVSLESTPNNVSCNAASDASISIAVTGGTTNYSFAWTKDGNAFSSDEDLTGLAPGTYQVTVTDANNCSVSLNAPVTITEPEVLAVSLESTPSNVSCNAASDASISIAVTGGTTNYSFAWTKDGNAFSSDEDLTGLAPGTYQVTVTDANNCSVSLNAPVTITEPEVLAVSLESTPSNVSCNAASDASISIAVTGGTTNYSFAWTKDGNAFSSDEDLTGLAPGTYQVTVTDANNCSVSLNAPVTITEPEVLAVSLESTPSNVSCNAASDASISIAVTGGTTNYSFAWTKDGNAFSSDEDLTGLAPGTYQVTVTDANNCSVSLNAPVTITEPEVLAVSLESTPSNVSCNAASDASISIAVTGGTTNYSFAWTKDGNAFSSDEDLTGLAPGTYQVTVTDANNCSVSLNAPVTITEPEVLAVSLESTPSNVSCNAASDASISIAVTGGTTNYSFAWTKDGNAFSSDEDLTGLAPGTYQVTVTDANNCSVSLNAPVTITEPEVLAVSLESTPSNVSCNAASDASISIAVTGGTTNYSFAWTKDGNAFSSDEDLTGLAPGTYQVTVTDANNCSVSLNAPVTITEPEVLAVSLESTPNNVSCNAASDASISIAVTGGTTNYSFAWTKDGNAFSSDEDLTGLAPGTYQVTVTDANNCSVSLNAPVTITEPEVLAVSLESTPSNVSCNAASDASISIAVTGGTTNYSFAWTKDGNAFSSDEDLTGLAPGTYQVTVTDANNCSVSLNAPVTITEPEVLAVSLESTPSNVSCNAASDASISIAVTGGTTNYSFAWTKDGNAFSSDEDLTGLAPGTYQVTVTDANNCSVSLNAPVTITEPEVLAVSLESTPSNVSCNAASDASISIAVTGGTTNYSFAWTKDGNAFSSDEDLTGLAPGTYQVTVTDANNCSVSLNAPVTITEPEVLAVSLESTPNNVSCNAASDASISIAITGGTTNYSFAWTKDGSPFSSDEDLTGLAPGTYQVTVTDANNCSVSLNAPVTITEPEVLAVSLESTPNNVSCNAASDASISIAVTGGTTNYSFAWTKDGNAFSSDEDLTGLAPGTYQVTVTDANNCSVSLNAPVTITEPEVLETSTTQVNVLCNSESSGSIDLTVTGGTTPYTYLWNNRQTTQDLSNILAGTYTVTITDANGCTASTSTTITEPASPLSINISKLDATTAQGCNNGSATVSVSGGKAPYSYQWSASANNQITETATNLTNGTHNIIITDANNCQLTQTIIIECVNTCDAEITINNVTDVLCTGSNTGSGTVSASSKANPSATFTFTWSNGQVDTGVTTSTLNNLTAGVYTVSVTIDGTVCQPVEDTISITEPSNELSVTTITTDEVGPSTADGTATVIASGGVEPYSYLWTPNGETTATITGLSTGDYTVTVTDANGCTDTITVSVNPGSCLNLSVTGASSPVVCNGEANGSVTATVTGGTGPFSYAWDSLTDTTATVNNLPAGNYKVTITDQTTLCTVNTTISINEPNALSSGIAVTNILCKSDVSGALDLTVNGGTAPYVFEWSNGDTSEDLINVSAGIYSVTITDANGCITTDQATIIEPNEVVAATIVSQTNIDCFNNSYGQVLIEASGGITPYSYSIDDGNSFQDNGTFSELQEGDYTVIVTDANGCSFSIENIKIEAIFSETVIINDDKCSDDGDIDLNDYLTGDTSGTWIVKQGNTSLDGNIFDPEEVNLGEYIFEYTSTTGDCVNTTEVTIAVNDDCIVLPCTTDDIDISRIITPNGDNWNEYFEIKGLETCDFKLDVQIFNRWGALIYEAKDYKNTWNGYAHKASVGNSNNVPAGTYFYIITINNSGLNPISGHLYVGTK